jgi:hypothetical protein
MMLRIDVDTPSLFYDQITQLEGVEYLFQFMWHPRESAWYIHLFDQDQNLLCGLIRLVVGFPLLRRFQHDPRTPPGCLMCIDYSQTNAEIAVPTDLGSRVDLMYITSDDPTLAGSLSLPSSLSLNVGTTRQLNAIGAVAGLVARQGLTVDQTQACTWASSAPMVASVSAGLVTAFAPGGAVITATLDRGVGKVLTATCAVVVS